MADPGDELEVIRRTPPRSTRPPEALRTPTIDHEWLRAKLAGELDTVRKDTLRYTVLTVLLTPGLLVLAALLIAFGLTIAGHSSWHSSFTTSLFPSMTGATGMMVAAYFSGLWRSSRTSAIEWWAGAGAAALLGVQIWWVSGYHGQAFWVGWIALTLAILILLGRVYREREVYRGFWDDELLDPVDWVKGDLDRAHLGLGFAIAGTEVILTAWGELAAGRAVWRGFDEDELAAAAGVLVAASRKDLDGVKRALLPLPRSSRRRVANALVHLELIRREDGQLMASQAGLALVSEVLR